MVGIDEDIADKVSEYIALKRHIISQMEQISDNRYYNILFKKYVQYKELQEIADEMGYEYKWLLHLHHDALEEFQITHLNGL